MIVLGGLDNTRTVDIPKSEYLITQQTKQVLGALEDSIPNNSDTLNITLNKDNITGEVSYNKLGNPYNSKNIEIGQTQTGEGSQYGPRYENGKIVQDIGAPFKNGKYETKYGWANQEEFLNGRKTGSQTIYPIAHFNLPYLTKVKITVGDKEVIGEVQDGGPYGAKITDKKTGKVTYPKHSTRIVDLSYGAFAALRPDTQGKNDTSPLKNLKIEIISLPPSKEK